MEFLTEVTLWNFICNKLVFNAFVKARREIILWNSDVINMIEIKDKMLTGSVSNAAKECGWCRINKRKNRDNLWPTLILF